MSCCYIDGTCVSRVKMVLTLLLIFSTLSTTLLHCHGQTIINVANGVYSTKAESEGLHLSSTSIFRPIAPLTLSLYFASSFSVFVNYQITVDTSAHFWTKLQITDDSSLTNAGSLVHYGTQAYKTATGYWMDYLTPGHYTFEVHYKSSSSISVSAGTDYQTAILQVMWFTSPYVVSAGVKCYPTPSRIYTYNFPSPIKDLKVTLPAYASRVVLAAYQLAIYLPSRGQFLAKMHQNNQQLKSTNMIQGYEHYCNLNSLWMNYPNTAEYEFGLTYATPHTTYFEDCRNNYQGNKNLYAMYLPQRCRVLAYIRPTNSHSISTTAWRNTDLSYTFTLSRTEHLIVRYQLSADLGGKTTYLMTRLVVDSVKKQTAAITGNTYYVGNSGMWQGALTSGKHTITVQLRSGNTFTHYVDVSRTRALDIVRCY